MTTKTRPFDADVDQLRAFHRARSDRALAKVMGVTPPQIIRWRETGLPQRRWTRNDGQETLKSSEIEPGRIVHNDWDKHLVETWAARKTRRARERAALQGAQD